MAAKKTTKKAGTQAGSKAGEKGAKGSKAPKGSKAGSKAALGGRITGDEAESLRALGSAYEARPDVGVKTLLDQARDLRKVAAKDVAALTKGTDLEAGGVDALAVRADLLERAEDDWDDLRTRRAEASLVEARAAAEALKRPATRALRYFLRADAEVEARLDEIAQGSGDADLVDDLRRLANLVDAAGDALAKAKDLPNDAATQLRAAAEALGDASSGAAASTEAGDALALRNRAFWWLRESMDEVRAAGRYVFADDARRLSKYRATGTLVRRPARGKKPPEA